MPEEAHTLVRATIESAPPLAPDQQTVGDGSVSFSNSSARGGADAGFSREPGHISLRIHANLDEVEQEWRGFEAHADCTAFQTCAWLSNWQRHIGERRGVVPAIVFGNDAQGRLLF